MTLEKGAMSAIASVDFEEEAQIAPIYHDSTIIVASMDWNFKRQPCNLLKIRTFDFLTIYE